MEEVAPIISRQKKKKRTQDPGTLDDVTSSALPVERIENSNSATPEPIKIPKKKGSKDVDMPKDSDKAKSELAETLAESETKKRDRTPTPKIEGKAVPSMALKDPYTLNQLYNDTAKAINDPEAFQKVLDEHISNIQTLFNQLLDAKELDYSSALFNLPPLSSYRLPPDSRKGNDYLDGNGYTMSSPFGEVYVTSKERRALQRGSAVHISDQNRPNDLLRRTIITSQGRVYRHLSQEEEDKVIELERRQEEDEQIHGELGVVRVSKADEADFPNIEGGLEELLRYGLRHGVSWVTDEKDDEGAMDEDDVWASDDDQTGELGDLTAGWQAAGPLGTMPTALANAKEQVAGLRREVMNKIPNLRGMDIETLQRTIKDTQAEVDAARKEMEAMEKKWVKKGREVAKWKESILKGKSMTSSE